MYGKASDGDKPELLMIIQQEMFSIYPKNISKIRFDIRTSRNLKLLIFVTLSTNFQLLFLQSVQLLNDGQMIKRFTSSLGW